MTAFIDQLLEQPILGIPSKHWQSFLRIFAEGVKADVIERKLKAMRDEAERTGLAANGLDALDKIQDALLDLLTKA